MVEGLKKLSKAVFEDNHSKKLNFCKRILQCGILPVRVSWSKDSVNI